MAGTSGRRTWALIAFGVFSLAGLAAADVLLSPSAFVPEAAAERPAQPVRVSRIQFALDEGVARYTGIIRPQHEADLGFRVPGKIVARLVEVGDRVRQGAVIALLDDTDARLELELAAAEVEAARVDLQRAEAEKTRSETLFRAGHVSQAALDRAISGAAQALARDERAARALALAQNRLDYTRLVAERDGVVTATLAEPGQVVAAGQPIVSLARTDAVDVVFDLPEQDRDTLAGTVATAEVWGAGGKSYDLKLRDIAPDVDPAGRTYRVRMTVVAPDSAVELGRTVTVQLVSASDQPTVRVPLAAVLNDGTGAAVWRLDASGARVEKVPVEVVEVTGQEAVLRGTLAEGDVIVSLGAHKIDPARPVRVVETHDVQDS